MNDEERNVLELMSKPTPKKKYRTTKQYKDLKAELLKMLDDRGIKSLAILSKVDEYMELWEARMWARDDIERRGTMVPYLDSKENIQLKKNDSAELQIKYSLQMIKLLQYLKIDPDALKQVDDEIDL